jgi:hypothetical protein
MKKHLFSATLLCLFTAAVGSLGQTPVRGPDIPAASANIPGRPLTNTDAALSQTEAPKLTRFNLNFSGGTPHDLVAAIEKATGKPLNVVIPDEFAGESIPALRMNQVTVPDLFRALEQASLVTVPYRTSAYYGGPGGKPSYSYQQMRTSLTFQTAGRLSDESVWYFRGRDKAPDPSIFGVESTAPSDAKICRFYALNPFLENGYKVEDITTAIQTGWKMLGEKETPNISFHKETKLLIAVGEPTKLEIIDAVLNALRPAGQPALGSYEERIRKIVDRATAPASAPRPAPPVEPEP